jgi:cytochrome c-type biogenesis protein CcmH/NrfG
MIRNDPQSPNYHLDEEQIDQLAWAKNEREQLQPGVAERGWPDSHVQACAECRQAVEARQEELTAMQKMLSGVRRQPGPDCPPADTWPLLAAGMLASTEAADHAAVCAHCGLLFRQAVEDVTSEPTPEESALVQQLPSSRPGMASVIAGRLADQAARQVSSPSARPEPVAQKSRRRYWWAAAVAAGLASVFVYWELNRRASDPDRLFAQMYSAHRSVELRFRGAARAPLRMTRGEAARRGDSSSPDLLRLQAQIAEGLTEHPNDPYWMAAKGRLDLLVWRYDSALTAFQRIVELQPDSETALTDLAAAYFERAEATGHDFDYGTAIELLSRALQKQPGDTVALFNRALTYERMFLYSRAIVDWQDLLAREPTGGWADEVRTRLAEAKKKVN